MIKFEVKKMKEKEQYERTKEEPTIFTAKVIDQSGSLRVTIPKREEKYNSIEVGDSIRVWIKKIVE